MLEGPIKFGFRDLDLKKKTDPQMAVDGDGPASTAAPGSAAKDAIHVIRAPHRRGPGIEFECAESVFNLRRRHGTSRGVSILGRRAPEMEVKWMQNKSEPR